MKHIFLFTALLIGVSAFSQEWEYPIILEYGDTISFSESSDIILMDTSITNLWEIAIPSKDYLDSAYSAPFAIITDSSNTYPDSADTYFELLFFQEGDPYYYMEQFFIGFIHKYDSDTLRDGGFMTISFDNGETYNNVIENPNGDSWYYDIYPNDGENSTNLYSAADTLFNGEFGYSGKSNDWVSTMLGWNLIFIAPPKGGMMDTIRFRFNFISDSLDNNREGWMIDDIYTFRVEVLSSVKDQNQVLFKLFPNPASNRIMVETQKDYQDLKMEIRSITAKETIHLSNGSGNRLEADGIDLETGVYLVTVYGDGEFLGTARCVMHR
ncbi:MAG: hypothetical protein ACJAQ4_000698 [Cryomorphaceae bacterium]|jgi:hypothetical protein